MNREYTQIFHSYSLYPHTHCSGKTTLSVVLERLAEGLVRLSARPRYAHAMNLDTPPLHESNFDRSADPGTDFYRYANGGWLDANPVPPAYGRWAAFNEVFDRNEAILHKILETAATAETSPGPVEAMVGDFYAAGMDVESIEAADLKPIQVWLDRIHNIDSVADLHSLITDMAAAGLGGLFHMGVQADYAHPESYLLYLSEGGLGLPERDYYFNEDATSIDTRESYVRYVQTMLSHIDPTRPHDDEAASVMQFETSLAEVSLTATEARDVEKTLNTYSLQELREATLDFDVAAVAVAHTGDDKMSVSVDNLEFFETMASLVAVTPVDTLRAYMRTRLIASIAAYLPERFDTTSFEFYGKTLGGQKEQKERWKRVLGTATVAIRDQISRLYVGVAFSPTAKARCDLMVTRLLQAMGTSIKTRTWMSDETRSEALAKLDAFRPRIGFPDEWRDYTGLDVTRDSYLGNALAARKFEIARKLAKLGTPVVSEWSMGAHEVNAYYHPLHNEIVFPAGILQPPFFNPELDDAINYGSIGAVIGHEITHGFDDQGSKFDATGKLRNWWSEADRERFNERADLLAKQYDSFEVLDDLTVNGRLTLGENIADLGGVSLAFAALETVSTDGDRSEIDGFTPQQRFFLAFATVWRNTVTDEFTRLRISVDPHSPGNYRCNGTLANFPPFAAAFDLTAGNSLMNTDDALVEIW